MNPSTRPSKRLPLLATALASAVLAACGGGGDAVGTGTGTLRVALTDAPACGYDAVNVTVEKVRVHRSASAGMADGGWEEIVLSPARRLDLLTLQNGALAELGQTPLPAGTYTQLRLVLAENDENRGGTTPLANSVVPTAFEPRREVPLTTPSAQQSGLKVNVNISIEPDRLADFVIDFKVCDSVVQAGRSGRYLLKPVLSVMPRYVSGVGGSVEAALANGDTSISLQQAGVEVRATTPDASGRFLLQPVPPGLYTLVMTAPARTTAVITGVTVSGEMLTNLTVTGGVTLPPSPIAVAQGTVTTPATPIDASVAMRQTLTGGTLVTVARRPVDGDSGEWRYTLPVAAPVVATWVATPAPLAFVPDVAVAGQYAAVAQSGSAIKAPVAVPLSAGATVTVPAFSFP